jgi:hypothetical protein
MLLCPKAIEKIKNETNLRIKINSQKISMFIDITLIAETEENLDQLIKSIDKIFIRDLRMQINMQKT